MDRAANPCVGDPDAGPLALGGEASLGFSVRFFLCFEDCGEVEVGTLLSEGFEGV